MMCEFKWMSAANKHKRCQLRDGHHGPHRDGSWWVAQGAEDTVRPWPADTGLLDGETHEPADGERIGTAGQFAARWNKLDPEGRQLQVDLMQQNAVLATRCVVGDHHGAVEALDQSRRAAQELAHHLNGMMDSLDESVSHTQVYEQLKIAWDMARAIRDQGSTASNER